VAAFANNVSENRGRSGRRVAAISFATDYM
jgi:hypothetical protein